MQAPAALQIADGGIECTIRYSRRRTLAIYVYSDLRVELRAPNGCVETELRRFLEQRQAWVRAKLAELAQRPARPNRTYVDGELQPFLGRQYPLALVEGRPHGVWLAAGRLSLRYGKRAEVPGRLQAWYRQQALAIFAERMDACYQTMACLGIPRPVLKVRTMRSRWGSCSRRAGVTLNLELIKYPVELIDYVITHELCHLREFNHGPRFYALMDRFLPEWPQRKESLKRLACAMPVD